MKNTFNNITKYCDKLIVALLLATVVIPPLFFDIRLFSVFDLSKLTALYFLTVAILMTWTVMLAFKQDFKFFHTPLDIPILAFIFIFIISTATSINPIMSFFGTYKRFEGLVPTLCYVFIFYTTINFINTREKVYLVIISIVGGAVVSSFYGIMQHLGFDMFQWSSFEARRVFATFGNPVFFSAYLVMTLPLAIILFLNISTQQKEMPARNSSNIFWIFFVLSLITYTTFWLTNTRACFVALLGSSVPLLVFIFKKQPVGKFKFVVLVASYIAIGIFFNVRHETSIIKHFASDINIPASTSEKPVLDNVKEKERPWIASKFSVRGSSFSRCFQYLAATRIIKDYPILGIGPDTIGIVYQKYLAKVFLLRESDKGFPFPRQDRIHNDILDTTVTRGIFGLGTYVWLLVTFWMFIVGNYKKLSEQNKILVLGLLAGIVSYTIQNEFSFGNTPIVILFWVMMGLCISIIRLNRMSEVLLKGSCLEPTPSKGHENLDNPLQSKLTGEKDREKKKKQFNAPVTKKDGGKGLLNEAKKGILTKRNVYRWVGCIAGLTAIGFVSIFILRVYNAEIYFERGRRLMEFEKINADAISENSLYLIKYGIILNPYETFYRDELCRTYVHIANKTKDESFIKKAYTEASNTLELIPQHFAGFYHFGMIYQMLNEYFKTNTIDDAIYYYKKAIDSDPFQLPFYSNIASVYIKKQELDKAIEALKQAYLIYPRDYKDIGRLSTINLQKGDTERALVCLNKTLEFNPQEAGYYNNYGAILNRKGLYGESINAFKKALELNPKDTTYLDNITKTYITMGKDDEIIPYYKKLIELDSSNADYYNNLGTVYKRQKQFEDAIQSFKKATELNPSNPVYTHNMAVTYDDQGMFSKAKELLLTFNQTNPGHNYLDSYLLLANLYMKDENWNGVISECERVIKLNEKSIFAYKMSGAAYYNLGKYELAEKMLNQTLALAPDDQEAKDLLAKIPNKVKKDS